MGQNPLKSAESDFPFFLFFLACCLCKCHHRNISEQVSQNPAGVCVPEGAVWPGLGPAWALARLRDLGDVRVGSTNGFLSVRCNFENYLQAPKDLSTAGEVA